MHPLCRMRPAGSISASEGAVTILIGASEWGRDDAVRVASAGGLPRARTGDFVQGPKFDYASIREICESCPVDRGCLEFELRDESITGLWGGTTDYERRLIRRLRVA